tara:strand:- start:415 stop:987 length:573 start_codon:yes stop_codon:yes gene_type:complete
MRQDTLINSIDGNPRYRVQKEGWDSRWDYAPREDLLCSYKGEQFLNYWKAWDIKYSDDGFNYNNIGLVTDFNGDIPTATISHGDNAKTITGSSLSEVCSKVIEVHEELLKEAEVEVDSNMKYFAIVEKAEAEADEKEAKELAKEAEAEAEPNFLNEEPIFDEDGELRYNKWLEDKGTEWSQRDDMQEPVW